MAPVLACWTSELLLISSILTWFPLLPGWCEIIVSLVNSDIKTKIKSNVNVVFQATAFLIDECIDFNVMSTNLGLFHTYRSGNHVHCTLIFTFLLLLLKRFFFFKRSYLLWCWPKKDAKNTKGLIEKHMYSSNRNKIQVDLVKQWLVGRKLRVQCGSDYPSTTQMVLHIIASRWLVHSAWRSRWRVFMEEGKSIM